VSDKLNEMWQALEAHKPKPKCAEAWSAMCKERTYEAARAAYYAAPEGSAAVAAAAAAEAAAAAWATEDYAQKAINAIKGVKP
jgi:hypothetical protein